MAQTDMQKKLISAIKKVKPEHHWKLLSQTIPYDPTKYAYSVRPGTMPVTVKLYQAILAAVSLYSSDAFAQISPDRFRLIERGPQALRQTCLEWKLSDDESFIVTVNKASTGSLEMRMSILEADGTSTPAISFSDMEQTQPNLLTAILLALVPHIVALDKEHGAEKICAAMGDLGNELEVFATTPWVEKDDIPDIAKEAAYFMDAVIPLMEEKMNLQCGDSGSSAPWVIEDATLNDPKNFAGSLLCENVTDWNPMLVTATGKGSKFGNSKITIGEAKAQYSHVMAHRKWLPAEERLIPSFDDKEPVMVEVMRIIKRIADTRNDKRPVCNIMWRGVTSYGKSTGIKQLAAILHQPLLIQTCHPAMEAADLRTQFVPKTQSDGIFLGSNGGLSFPAATAVMDAAPKHPLLDEAIQYVKNMEPAQRDALLDANGTIPMMLIDPDSVAMQLLGRSLDNTLDLDGLVMLYMDLVYAFREAPVKARLAELEALSQETDTGKKDSTGMDFMLVAAPYIKAIANGYIVELQEVSRIRDSGVMVSVNELDRPGGQMELMNGATVTRHKDSICCITDNVGYASCRAIDPSVIRRQDLIIDSYEMTKKMLVDRAKRNYGITDTGLLDKAYDLWLKVKEYCDQNAISEGSVSATEYERLVQAVYYDGPDSWETNLDDCVISKATSSIEDQRDIRTACMTLLAA